MQAFLLLKRANGKMSEYLSEDIKHLNFSKKSFVSAIKDGAKIFSWWSLPAACFVYFARGFSENVPIAYFELAISEGIGPHLWNVIGALGLVLTGLLLLFPNSRALAKAAYQVLSNTFAMGGLTFGLVVGKLIFGMAHESVSMDAWHLWLVGLGSVLLTVQVLYLNFALWCLACIARPSKDGDCAANRGIRQVRWPLRLLAFICLTVVPIGTLMLEA